MIRIGQQVVCIQEIEIETPRGMLYSGPTPILDEVYTVTGFGETGMASIDIADFDYGIELAELRGPRARKTGASEWIWLAWPVAIFRPVQKTDISIFTKMLNPKRARTPA